MCFCERCVADKTVPQWIESSPTGRANLAWHLTRALHQAGRCCDCGECERACPADIPLGLLNRKLAQVVEERYEFRATDDPEVPAPVGSYKLNDTQEFIL
jgi:Fe-S oxidoreductase